MIPYSDLERAIGRWKLRQAGGGEPATPVPESPGASPYSEAVAETSSGLIALGDAEIDESESS